MKRREYKDMLKIGCHLSSSKGYLAMGKQAVEIGANVFQFFTRNPRGGKAKEINEEDVKKFLEFAKENGITNFLAHAPYTLNACAADERIREFARGIYGYYRKGDRGCIKEDIFHHKNLILI